ncbi:hypothetical protein ABIA32_006416 [Streptacidiphilus sp. MAP12-20]|uniref:DUF6325 family protein n=1 Tax=Streptacidiphilus sp. MAP12-20 TaxID=3156299 RepID=UPI00351264B3
MSDDLEDIGPVDYLVVEFPGEGMGGEGLPLLVDLVDRGIIRILDLLFVRKEQNGTLSGIDATALGKDGGLDLTVFAGASSGLLSEDDMNEVAAVLAPGSSAGILVYENLWAAPFVSALRRHGAQLVASGRIPLQDLLEALDTAEAGA